jgi:hypothetical protein
MIGSFEPLTELGLYGRNLFGVTRPWSLPMSCWIGSPGVSRGRRKVTVIAAHAGDGVEDHLAHETSRLADLPFIACRFADHVIGRVRHVQ